MSKTSPTGYASGTPAVGCPRGCRANASSFTPGNPSTGLAHRFASTQNS